MAFDIKTNTLIVACEKYAYFIKDGDFENKKYTII